MLNYHTLSDAPYYNGHTTKIISRFIKVQSPIIMSYIKSNYLMDILSKGVVIINY